METTRSLAVLCAFLVTVSTTAATDDMARMPAMMKMRWMDIRSTTEFIHSVVNPVMSPNADLSMHERMMFGTGNKEGQFMPKGVELMSRMITPQDLPGPRLTSVRLPLDRSNPRVIYWPTCVQVERCGGCCGYDRHESVPHPEYGVEPFYVHVMETVVAEMDSTEADLMRTIDVVIDRHVACECRCKADLRTGCTSPKEFEEENCECRCPNEEQERPSCQPDIMRWDEHNCRCICRKGPGDCIGGERFDYRACMCVENVRVPSSLVEELRAGPCDQHICRSGYRPVVTVGSTCECHRVSG